MFAMKMVLMFISLLAFTGTVGAGTPQRIISLAPSITKSLYLLGAEERIIAVTVYCPPEARSKEKIGNMLEPNLEKIVSLSPDLVIATKEGNQETTVKTLRKLGLTVFVMGPCDNFTDICEGFLSLGKLVGKERRADEIIAKAKDKIADVQKRTRDKKGVTVFWEVGAQPLFTVSRNSFVNDFISLAGGKNIFSDFDARYPQISREEVIRRDPETIIMVTMGDVTVREKAFWKKFKEMKAVQTDRIYVLNDSLFTDPTPAALADGVEKVADILYGSSAGAVPRETPER